MYLADFENTLRICSNNDIQMSFFSQTEQNLSLGGSMKLL